MITSKTDYRTYLSLDRISSQIPPKSFINSIKLLLFPSYEWRFIKAMRWLEYCENVVKKRPGGEYCGY